MMLVELTPIQSADLPVAAFRDHLRLGTGFADDAVQDAVLESFLRAAIAAIEARIGKALLERTFGWSLTRWRDDCEQPLPVAPVSAVIDIVEIDDLGFEQSATGSWVLLTDANRPVLRGNSGTLPRIPRNGSVRVEMTAGFGGWSDIPADLTQAVLLLAAHFYENRREGVGEGPSMPFGVASLIEKYRVVRTLAGKAAQ